jgi:hypothetical protein
MDYEDPMMENLPPEIDIPFFGPVNRLGLIDGAIKLTGYASVIGGTLISIASINEDSHVGSVLGPALVVFGGALACCLRRVGGIQDNDNVRLPKMGDEMPPPLPGEPYIQR